MQVSNQWEKEDILALLRQGKTTEQIKKIYAISTRTLTKYRKQISKENELTEMKLKIDYATKLVPEHLDLDTFLRAKYDNFARKVFPLIDKITAEIENRIENKDVATKDLMAFKIDLIKLFIVKGNN